MSESLPDTSSKVLKDRFFDHYLDGEYGEFELYREMYHPENCSSCGTLKWPGKIKPEETGVKKHISEVSRYIDELNSGKFSYYDKELGLISKGPLYDKFISESVSKYQNELKSSEKILALLTAEKKEPSLKLKYLKYKTKYLRQKNM